jgi:diguanylate cyclase (GGDEF)-like protein
MAQTRRTARRSRPDPLVRTTDAAQRELDDRAALSADQTAADLDQTQADADQSASDADQLGSDTDQALADREQQASDRDQAAADRDDELIEATAADTEHERSRTERNAVRREREATAANRSKTTAQRLVTATLRDEAARLRDLTAAARDRDARARDDAADARDRAAQARERAVAEAGTVDEAFAGLRAVREASAASRRQATAERSSAAADREAAAADRRHAAMDRHLDGLDELTGVFRRGTGEMALVHEIDRSRRSGEPLVLAMIDVDALKAVNDNQGHAAGDALLRDVAAAITTTLRSYDVTVRWGGDEFVCAMSDMTLQVASDRLDAIQRTLRAHHPGASISSGHAELREGDTLRSLISRADAALYLDKTGCEDQRSQRANFHE